ncbi:molecular chaperone GroEL [Micromonospora aurantiaca]|nr:molecular chaperone GroEL [Micromonospora aurantiaca]
MPHRRTAAPPHRRTAAPPHRRTAAPPHVAPARRWALPDCPP